MIWMHALGRPRLHPCRRRLSEPRFGERRQVPEPGVNETSKCRRELGLLVLAILDVG